ncbi:ABC transporter permease [Aquabacterium sp.]|uniref:ABC transporter permease n=1 Tax=Aquabacterium sp. TaxID=1872578 RepID=UPI002D10ABD5|nr:hypothetical protein [Aquabacterium sp.]HSW04076.1 hypothetical protein [Aquabacterium sp.]
MNAEARAGLAAPGRAPAAIGLALLLAFGLLCLVSAEPVHAFRQLLTGALPVPYWSDETGWTLRRLIRFGAVLDKTATLTLLGLAMLFGLRARQFSMGADGQLMLAALAALAVGVALPPLGGWSWLAAGAVAAAVGFAWGLLPGWLKTRFDANEIVTSLMLNIVALQGYRWIVSQGFNDPAAGFLATPALLADARPPLIGGASVLLLLIVLAPALAAWLLNRSTLGYEIRVVGDAPAFARQAGMPVERTVMLALGLGGAFAGLAGLHLSHGLLGRLPADLPQGVGFEGLVVALLAANEPRRVPLAAFGYALLEGGAQAMERGSDVPREMVLVIQALVVLLVVSVRLDPLAALRRAAAALRRPRGAQQEPT